VVAVNRLKLCVLVVASGLGLLALALVIVLTGTVTLVITLAIVATIIFLLSRWGLAEDRRTKAGG
jgi:Flp pilus assembly protein TadB